MRLEAIEAIKVIVRRSFRATESLMQPLPTAIGRYEVLKLLGQGGMGRVLLARDSVLGRRVAIKLLRDDLGLPSEMKKNLFKRMRQEARAAAAIGHPHMVTLHDMGEEKDIGLYLVFEYVDGLTLRDQLAEGPLTPEEVCVLAEQIGGALDRAHATAVIHRDVKPENVLLSRDGAKLTDFGIARLPDSTLTQGQTILGTPAYSAPEALTRGEFGPRSDQFAFAATLHEALSGRRAFPGDDALQVATSIARGDLLRFPERRPGDADLTAAETVLVRALEKDPKRRYSSCSALALALEEALTATKAVPGVARRGEPRWARGDRAPEIASAKALTARAPPGQDKTEIRARNVVLAACILAILGAYVAWRRLSQQADMHPEASAASASVDAGEVPALRPPKPQPRRTKPSASSSTPAKTSASEEDGG